MSPLEVSAAMMNAWTINTDCVAMRMRIFGRRSASTPPKSDKKSVGPKRKVMATPSITGESVRSSTSQARATSAIHVPTRLTS